MAPGSVRRQFTDDDDAFLVKYIAKYNPNGNNRKGNVLYQRLEENADGKWPWASRHPWQSWRERYVGRAARFDRKILDYQKKKGLSTDLRTLHSREDDSVTPPSSPSPPKKHKEDKRTKPDKGKGKARGRKRRSDDEVENATAKRRKVVKDAEEGTEARREKGKEKLIEEPSQKESERPPDTTLKALESTKATESPSNAVGSLTRRDIPFSEPNLIKHEASVTQPVFPSIYPDLSRLHDVTASLDDTTHIPGSFTSPLSNGSIHDLQSTSIEACSQDSPMAPIQSSRSPEGSRKPHATGANKHLAEDDDDDPNDDYFVSPKPDPPRPIHPSHVVGQTPAAFPIARHHGPISDACSQLTSVVPASQQPIEPLGRKPLRVTEGPFRREFAGTYMNGRRRVLLKERLLDVEDDDTDVEDAASPIWPPKRNGSRQQINKDKALGVPPAMPNKDVSKEGIDGYSVIPQKAFKKSPADSQLNTNGGSEVPPQNQAGPSRAVVQDSAKPTGNHAPFSSTISSPTLAPSGAENDPFASAEIDLKDKVKGRMKIVDRRQTFAGFTKNISSIPLVNLSLAHSSSNNSSSKSGKSGSTARERILPSKYLLESTTIGLNKFRHRRIPSIASSTEQSVSSETSHPQRRQKRPSMSDQRLIEQAGVEFLIQRMAENHGFSKDIVMRVWRRSNDLPKTDEILRRMREAAEKVALENLPAEVETEVEETKGMKDDSMRKRRSLRLSASHSELHWSPLGEKVVREKYSPPTVSRAAQYIRLNNEGREEEAVRREIRRSTGFSSSLLKPANGKINEVFRTDDPDSPTPGANTSLTALKSMVVPHSKPIWTAEDDEVLLAGDSAAHEELERRKGRGSVKIRMAELVALGVI